MFLVRLPRSYHTDSIVFNFMPAPTFYWNIQYLNQFGDYCCLESFWFEEWYWGQQDKESSLHWLNVEDWFLCDYWSFLRFDDRTCTCKRKHLSTETWGLYSNPIWWNCCLLPLGLSGQRAIVIARVCLSVCTLYFVCMIIGHRFELKSPNLHQTCILGYSHLVLKMVVIGIDL